jgi:hypothetical protein
MATSSVTVVGNAWRLRRFHATGGPTTAPPRTPAVMRAPVGVGASR